MFLCSRQPNEQARVVAPVITGAKLKVVAHSENATNMIIVRHPFDRWIELVTTETHYSIRDYITELSHLELSRHLGTSWKNAWIKVVILKHIGMVNRK